MQHSAHPPASAGRLAWVALAVLAALGSPEAALAAPFGFPDPVTPYGEQVNDLYQLMSWIGVGILAAVEIALVAALLKFRKKPGENREPARWNHNTKLEILWTAIPFALLVVILVPTFRALAYLANVPERDVLRLEVVGRQFFWEYRFPELGVQFATTPTIGPGTGEEELYLPINRKIKVVLTAADVIHGWWVPQFGVQQMTTPGNLAMIPLEIKKAGLYEGACTYLCGTLHGAMRIRVRAVEPAAFDSWIASRPKRQTLEPITKTGKIGLVAPPPQKPAHGAGEGGTEGSPHGPSGSQEGPHGAAPAAEQHASVDPAALAAAGKEIYANKCAACHGANGEGMGTVFPPVAGAEQVNGSDEQLVGIILNGLSGPITVNGKAYNGQMPAWRDQLSDEEVASVATFLRTSWGNNGKAIAPAAVKAQR